MSAGFLGFGQNLQKTDSIMFQKPTFKSFDLKPKISFNSLDFYTQADFSVYNRTTGFTDNFMLHNDEYVYKNSQMFDHNLIYNNKIDSFNPSGTDDFGASLINGALNMAFDFLNKKK